MGTVDPDTLVSCLNRVYTYRFRLESRYLTFEPVKASPSPVVGEMVAWACSRISIDRHGTLVVRGGRAHHYDSGSWRFGVTRSHCLSVERP